MAVLYVFYDCISSSSSGTSLWRKFLARDQVKRPDTATSFDFIVRLQPTPLRFRWSSLNMLKRELANEAVITQDDGLHVERKMNREESCRRARLLCKREKTISSGGVICTRRALQYLWSSCEWYICMRLGIYWAWIGKGRRGRGRHERGGRQSLQSSLICLEVVLPFLDFSLCFFRTNRGTYTLQHGHLREAVIDAY